ncbi:GIY-YIG nuclease family protein [Methylobacillus methanolivorans]|uniref:GIY-YIG nuclease family protein n=1 Tax=Methylobacillus methanolivorans TaxID=1848927 RepID=A0ABW8GLP5_9PROT
MSYIDKLIANCQAAKVAKSIKEFEGNDLSALSFGDKAIYIIEEINGNPEQTFLDFSRYKQKKERACAKLNSPSSIMYVGSSTTDVKKRIEQHMGQGHKGTYALHLHHWFRGEYKIIIRQYDVSNEVLQIIEDDISDRLRPAFGKQGSNNK